ncbi:Predicted phosphohydrolase, MPP superfamily [Micrococcales bacterium KH10]|nr:Predicted phosphohydrolase, MPP superfamily [Micrococcales bacterium KH10]
MLKTDASTSRCGLRPALWSIGAVTAAGAATAAWAAFEAHRYTLREVAVPLLPTGAEPVRVLHISDIHLIPGQVDKIAWLRDLSTVMPDVVVNTGDNFGHRDALYPLLHALEPLLDVPGAFVLGSNDYFAPSFRNPLRYLLDHSGSVGGTLNEPDLPWEKFVSELTNAGWADLGNRRSEIRVGEQLIDFVGLDDPHIGRDELPAPQSNADEAIRLGVVHAPYRRALDALHADGAALILAGHTHGGQVCLPGYGALTTNCDLDTARVKGLSGWPAAQPDEPGGADSTWLHVSEGVGTNPFVRLRLACRPAATLISLTSR